MEEGERERVTNETVNSNNKKLVTHIRGFFLVVVVVVAATEVVVAAVV